MTKTANVFSHQIYKARGVYQKPHRLCEQNSYMHISMHWYSITGRCHGKRPDLKARPLWFFFSIAFL